MESNSDIKLIEGIRSGEIDFTKLYNKYYRFCTASLIKNGASLDEANDVYQECMIVIHKKITSPDFTLTSKLSTFLYSITKNLWLKELDYKSKFVDANTSALNENNEDENILNSTVLKSKNLIHEDVYDEDDLKVTLIKNLIDNLPYLENKIINLFLNGKNTEEVRIEMGFTNRDVVKTKKSKALKTLRNKLNEIKNIQSNLPIFEPVQKDDNEMEKLFKINPTKNKSSYARPEVKEEIITPVIETIVVEVVEEIVAEIKEEPIFESSTLPVLPDTIEKEEKKRDSKFKVFLSFFNKLLK